MLTNHTRMGESWKIHLCACVSIQELTGEDDEVTKAAVGPPGPWNQPRVHPV